MGVIGLIMLFVRPTRGHGGRYRANINSYLKALILHSFPFSLFAQIDDVMVELILQDEDEVMHACVVILITVR